MFATINSFLDRIDNLVWGIPLIVAILVTGLFLTLRLQGVQFSNLPRAFRLMRLGREKNAAGEVSSFGALCTALSATIGTGNIVGVATAIVAGGPGALFWMWLAALFGMATKYAECLLSIKYREVKADGHILGGPFYAIEKGMGKNWKWLAMLFAFFGTLVGLFGIGTFTQINGITSAVNNFFDPQNTHMVALFGNSYSLTVVIAGVIIALCAALVIIGGLKRISSVAQVIVPFMVVLYFCMGIVLLLVNAAKIPAAFVEIFQGAFGLKAAAGGMMGAMIVAMQKGIARGIFSNEAGLGSAPIAASAAQVSQPVQQALVSMTGTFLDTIVVCTITGLAIVISGSWNTGLQGVAVTSAAFSTGLPFLGRAVPFILMLCLVFFAFTTILGWDYYSERCIEYMSNGNMAVVYIYRWLYIICLCIGPYMTVSAVWTIADIVNGLMAIPNLISLLALNGVVVKLTRDYLASLPAGSDILS